jgi:hypothetical protein
LEALFGWKPAFIALKADLKNSQRVVFDLLCENSQTGKNDALDQPDLRSLLPARQIRDDQGRILSETYFT